MVDFAYHWSPASRRGEIQRLGLAPGALSRNGAWHPPFVCLSRDPDYALGSSEAQTPVTEPMDLWRIDLAEVDVPREEFDFQDEMRFYDTIPAHFLTLIETD